ncbi:hypothetical protein KEM52_005877 [Ascosphaera acerosa]|nr:hypothetical protein KEM52_005877 [Ascosphaera acerosa]
MSTRFDADLHEARTAIQEAAQDLWDATSDAAVKEKAHEVAHRVGERLTGGPESRGYMTYYLYELQHNPLRTKMFTSGFLSALQEFIASVAANDKSKHGNFLNARVPKMAMYGAFVSAPLGHLLIGILQRMFRGKTSIKAKIWQILVSNLIISPIQNIVYIFFMAIIAGAREWHQIRRAIKASFFPIMRVSWITSPISLAVAQRFVPEHAWVPFFNLVGFVIGTYVNYQTKRVRLNAINKKLQESRMRKERRRNMRESDFDMHPQRGARQWERDAREARDARDAREGKDAREPRDGREKGRGY